MRSSVVYEHGDTRWGANVPDLPGCVAVGADRAEVETPESSKRSAPTWKSCATPASPYRASQRDWTG